MKYINIPGTILNVSAVSYGPALAGTIIDKEKSFYLLDKYVEMGGNAIDTAHVYANWLNMGMFMSEKTIGEWLTARNLHGKVHVFTKGAHMDLATMDISRVRPHDIITDIDESIDALQEDSLSLYWLHRDDPTYPVEIIVDTMSEAVNVGKIKYWAGSNWSYERFEQACTYAAANDLSAPVGFQNMWSMATTNPPVEGQGDHTLILCTDDDIEYYRKNNSVLFAYSSQAGGYFAKLDKAFRNGEKSVTMYNVPDELKNGYYNEKTLHKYIVAKRIAKERGISVNDVAVAYMTSQSFTCIPIFSTYNDEQFESTMRAADLTLTEAEINELDS